MCASGMYTLSGALARHNTDTGHRLCQQEHHITLAKLFTVTQKVLKYSGRVISLILYIF